MYVLTFVRNSNFVCNIEFCTIEGVHNNEHILYFKKKPLKTRNTEYQK